MSTSLSVSPECGRPTAVRCTFVDTAMNPPQACLHAPLAASAIAILLALFVGLVASVPPTAQSVDLGVRFAVIGDFGTGRSEQYELARVMTDAYRRSPYDLVLTVGDNIYGVWSQRAVAERFETPYSPLLERGVKFFASLGNHDDGEERRYPAFNMGGARYYTFTRANVSFFALDSNYLDPEQLAWFRRALAASSARWKIAYFHHPLYSSGQRHGSESDLRALLEPIFVRHQVQVVFSGHDHVYERVKPQMGITYFVCGSSGQLRRGNLDRRSALTAAGFDQDEVFLLVDVNDQRLQFTAISRADTIVDSGEIRR